MSAPRNAVTIVGLALVAAMSVVVALLMAEGAVRIRHWVRHGSAAPLEDSLSVDAATGLRVPHGNDRVHINALGFRGPEIEARKPAGTVRLAFLGGSTTFCAEASSDETTWPHVVWRELSAAKAPHTFDYINAGVPGYRIVHLTQTLRQRIAPLAPDVVVIYEATNDLSVDSRELARR